MTDLIERLEAASGRITELERQLKVAREGLMEVTDYGDLQAVRIARQALANMEQADD